MQKYKIVKYKMKKYKTQKYKYCCLAGQAVKFATNIVLTSEIQNAEIQKYKHKLLAAWPGSAIWNIQF